MSRPTGRPFNRTPARASAKSPGSRYAERETDVRNVLSAFLVSLGAASIGCSGNSSPTSLNGGGSSGANGSSGGNSNGGSNSSGGDMTGSSSGGGSNSSGSSSGGPSGSGSSGGSSGSSSSGGSSGGTDASIAAAYPSGPYCTPAGSAGHMDVGCV